MSWQDVVQILFFLFLLFVCSHGLSAFLFKVYKNEKVFLSPIFGPIENFIYKIASIDKDEQHSWSQYTLQLILFGFVTCLITFFLLFFQGSLPFNPQNMKDLSFDLSLNTAISFLTNTNWQAYNGESSLSYFSQMVALTPQNFLSAAVGLSAIFAIIRGLTQEKKEGLGNFYKDLTRSVLYILLPICFVLALFYISQGVIQNLSPYLSLTSLDGVKQTIPQGPVASQVAIKMLGTNGAGFFGANSAHPFENPTAFVNFIQIFSAILIPSSLVFLFGRAANHFKHALSIWIVMILLLLIGLLSLIYVGHIGNELFLQKLNLSSSFNMEGNEFRFGHFSSALFTNITTTLSLGATNLAHSSLLPLGLLVTFLNMMLNEVIFGGVGCGLYGMILHVILAIFLAGLMVGRTPEYFGKKIETNEIILTLFPLIGVATGILVFTALACMIPTAIASLGNPGAHGFSEFLYAYTSTTQNNGSALGSLNVNTPYFNYTTSFTMLIGRYLNLIPVLAIAGYMAKKKIRTEGENSFPIHGGLFIILLIGVIIIFGALTYFPALALGPISEHLQFIGGKIFSLGGQ